MIPRNKRRNLLAAATEWHGGIVETLSGQRSGRTYRVPGTRQFYTASAPGEPPASRTGQLRENHKFRIVDDNESAVGTDLDHAEYLEKGTSKMAPRPYFRPGAEKRMPQIQARLADRWDI